jgi:type I restriction enzyme, S subunit
VSGLSTLPKEERWAITRLGAIAEKIVDGSHNPPPKVESGRPMLSARNIEWGRIDFSEYREIADDAFKRERVRTDTRPGDVLLTIVGTIGRAAVVAEAMPEFTLQRSVALLRLRGVDSKFCMYQLLSESTQDWLRKSARGSAQQGVYLKTLKDLPLVIPPLDEQRAIVAEIEKQFTRLEAGVAGLRRVQANLKRYRAAVLKAACEGKLVPTEAELARQEGRTYETGAQLLERILTERRQKWNGKGKYKEPLKTDTANLPPLPEGWTWATVEQASSWLPGSIQSGPFGSHLLHSEFVSEGVLAIGIDNVLDGRFSLGSNHRIKPEKYSVLRKFTARPGDVVVTVMATVGRVCVLPESLEPAIITKHCYRITPAKSGIAPRFLALALRADGPTRKHIFGNVRGQTRPGINGPILKAAPVPVPPVTEQFRIIAEVERRLSLVEEIEAVVDANFQRATRLRQSILAKMFHTDSALSFESEWISEETVMPKPQKLTTLPAARQSDIEDYRIDLESVLSKHPDGLTPEALFIEAGYRGDQVDDFYRDLSRIEDHLEKLVLSHDPMSWPSNPLISIKLKKR